MVSWHWHVFVWTCELLPRMALRHPSFFFRYHPHISRSIGTIHTSLDRSHTIHTSLDRSVPSTHRRTSTVNINQNPPYESRSESRAVVGWTIIMWQVHVLRWQYQVHIIFNWPCSSFLVWYGIPKMSSAWSRGRNNWILRGYLDFYYPSW